MLGRISWRVLVVEDVVEKIERSDGKLVDGIVVLVKREMMVILLLPFRCGVALRERERE